MPNASATTPLITVILPTFNERHTIVAAIDAVTQSLAGVSFRIVVVDDDSPDGTAEIVESMAEDDSRVVCVRRRGQRGLASACVCGFDHSDSRYFAVMDADLQHDATILPLMLERIEQGGLDVVVGTRYANGGSVGDWGRTRQLVSRVGTWLARNALELPLSDPMSGFFVIRHSAFEACRPRLSQRGFKLLIDLFIASPHPFRLAEVPYHFRVRAGGQSKLTGRVAVDYLRMIKAHRRELRK